MTSAGPLLQEEPWLDVGGHDVVDTAWEPAGGWVLSDGGTWSMVVVVMDEDTYRAAALGF